MALAILLEAERRETGDIKRMLDLGSCHEFLCMEGRNKTGSQLVIQVIVKLYVEPFDVFGWRDDLEN